MCIYNSKNKEIRSTKGIGNKIINDIELSLVKKVIDSQHLFRFSEFVNESFSYKFEKEVSKMYNNYHCLLFPSATLALLAFLKSLKLPKGSEVIISPFGWVANYSVLRLENLRVIFTPLDSDLNIDIKELEKKISKKTRIIIATHLMGRKQKYIKEISEIAKNKKIYLVEDIAQSFGVGMTGKKVGTYGDFTYGSLNRFKILSAGDGGFAISKNKKIFKNIQSMHDQGCVVDDSRRVVPKISKEGLSMRVNELTASVAYAQIVKFFYIKKQVLKTYNVVQNMMNDFSIDEIIPEDGDIPYYFLFRSSKIPLKKYPPLRLSGWHYAGNIPYLKKEYNKQKKEDKKLINTEKILSTTYSVGSGLIQEHLSTPIGLGVNYNDKEKENLLNSLKKFL